MGQKSFAYRESSFFNNLPKELKDINNVQTFKKKLFLHLFYD